MCFGVEDLSFIFSTFETFSCNFYFHPFHLRLSEPTVSDRGSDKDASNRLFMLGGSGTVNMTSSGIDDVGLQRLWRNRGEFFSRSFILPGLYIYIQ